jgi:hypothetical protein
MPNVINATSTGNGGLITQGDDSGILNIQTNETTAITVDASQNVGIGTTSPTALTSNKALTINSPTSFGSLLDLKTNETLNLRVFSNASNSGLSVKTATPLLFDTNDTERMRIDSSGNLLVGTTTSPSNSGNISALGAIKGGAVYQSSGYENATYTLTTPAIVYSLNKDQGAAGGSSTTTFNITGVSNADGAFLFIYLRCSNTAGGINCGANIQVHGTQLFSSSVQNTTKTISFGAFRQNGSWVATASATGNQISAFP